MHPLILLGLILIAGVFAGLGALVLRFTPWPGLRWTTLLWFVFSAFVGAGAFGIAYEAMFADATGALTTDNSLVFLLVGIPIAGSLVGWLGAGAAALVSQRIQR
jgi:nucleoside recognition membrane protein YjiH